MSKTIQQLLVDKINEETTKDILCNELNRCAKRAKLEERKFFVNTSLFFKSLFESDYIDVARLTLELTELTLKTREVLYKYANEIGCDQLKIAVSVIDYKLSLVNGVRKLG